jgi:hypothetical protein
MSGYPFAFPALTIRPLFEDGRCPEEVVDWFRADDTLMDAEVQSGWELNGYASCLLFDALGGCWRVVGVTILPPEGAGWRQRVRAFLRIGRRFRLKVEALADVPFDEVRRRVCAAYGKDNGIGHSIGIDREADNEAEIQAMIDGEVARLAEAVNLPDLIDRIEDLHERRKAEAH